MSGEIILWRGIILPSPSAPGGVLKQRTAVKTRMAGEHHVVAGRAAKPVDRIEIGGRTMSGEGSASYFEPMGISPRPTGGLEFEGMRYVRGAGFQKVAAQVARQAGEEPDANEAQRLLSIAEYWVRLAEIEDWERDRPVSESSH